MRKRLFGALCVAMVGVASLAARPLATAEDRKLLESHKLPLEGPALLEYLKNRFTSRLTPAQINALIEQMGDDSFVRREEATRKLVEVGPSAKTLLQAALSNPDPEIRHRAEQCLTQMDREGLSAKLLGAAIRVLADQKPPGALGLLLDNLPAFKDEAVALDIQEGLNALAVARDGKVDPLLIRALKDPVSSRRGAAATALLKVPGGDHLAEVRKLLFDPDAEVRVAVALDLVQKGDKEAIPALIDGLDQPSSARFGRIEDILIRLAREQSPILTGEDLPARREYQKAWRTWWKDHGAKIDMALLDAKPKMLGRTLIVLLDANQVVDLDETNKVRRKIDDIEMALDMEALPGDRVLLAEYRANRVSERDAEGKVIWERSVPEPLTAQRLLNGNTFIASKDYLLEVDRKGKQVFRYNPPAATQIMRARKLPSGEILMVSQLGASQLTRLSRFGKELKSFPVDVSTSGGRLEVTPAGNILVPEMYSNRIVEYDPDGRVVRAIPAQQPIACTLLPSGNLLVTSMTEKRAVELDRAGKEVWEYRRDTRVTRAVRY